MSLKTIIMRGQFVFEFLIAGLIFFTIVVYTISYLNVNVSDFKSKFYHNRLQSKAIQISEVLMGGGSYLSIADSSEFNLTKIQEFNITYCNLSEISTYQNLVNDLHLKEKTVYGVFSDNIKIYLYLLSPIEILLDCGPMIPRNITKAEVGRVGVFNGEMAKLEVVVW